MTTTAPASHPAARPAPAAADRTPARERWLDLARAGALAVVVVGHVLIAIVHRRPDGTVEASALLDVAPWTHPLTWVVQVMAVFFAVGGYAAAGSVRSREITTPAAWGRWAGARAAGLIAPALPLLVLWLAAGPMLAGPAGVDDALVRTAASAALVPLWFLATYVLVQALVPMWVAVVDRGRGAAAVAALLLGVAAVDALHLTGLPIVGYANFLLVWSIPTLLGVAVRAGRQPHLPAVAAGALAGALALVAWAGYAIPVVGVTGTERSNNAPPSLLLALHGLAYAATVLHLAPRTEAALGRGRRPALLAAASAWSMPVYLWHMTGLVVLGAGLLAADVPGLGRLVTVSPLTPAWWALRPVTVAAVLLVTVGLLRAAAPVSAAAARLADRRAADRPAVVGLGLLASSAGIGGIVTAGTAVPPLAATAALVVGVAALLSGRRPVGGPAPGVPAAGGSAEPDAG